MDTATRNYSDNTKIQPHDRRRMFGFSGGMPHMIISPLASNQPTEEIGQGQLILFKPHVSPNVDGDFKPAPIERAPKTFANVLTYNFGTDSENDWGYRTLSFLTELEYDKDTGVDEADLYFDAVHPKFSQIEKTCEMGLEVLVFNDNDDVPRPCPTCRLQYLASDECKVRMAESGLRQDILTQLHEALVVSYTQSRAFAQKKLDESKSEIDKGRNGQPSMKLAFTDVDNFYMKMLHRKEAHIEQAELIANQSLNQGRAIAEGLKGASTDSDPTQGMSNAEKAEFYTWKAEKEAKAQVVETPVQPIITEPENTEYVVDMQVLCDGEKGRITEAKTAGWFVVALENGGEKTVRKDRLAHIEVDV